MIRGALGLVLVVVAGHGLLRLVAGAVPVRCYGVLGALALSTLAGFSCLALVTTLAGVLGGPTRPLPVIAPLLAVVAAAGLRRGPRSGVRPRVRFRDPRLVGDLLVAAVAALAGCVLAAASAALPVITNDEYALWMVRARTLSQSGALDPQVFLGGAAAYQQLDYPLLLPSVAAWGDGLVGHPSDAFAHVALGALFAAATATVGWAVVRLAGPVPAVVAVLVVLATPTVLSRQALELVADVPVFGLALAMVVVLAVWLRDGGRPLLAAAAVLGAAAANTKVEGALFLLAAFGAAAAVTAGRRRATALGLAGALAGALPWVAWSRAQGLGNVMVNEENLSLRHLRAVLPLAGDVVRGLLRYWPDLGPVPLLLVVPAALLAVRAGHPRLVGYFAVTFALITAGMAVQYLLSAPTGPSGAAFLRYRLEATGGRVLLVPGVLLTIAVPVLAGAALQRGGSAGSPRE